MCMAALVWAGIGGVVYGTSIATVSQKLGWRQITISASEVVSAASTFRHVALLGGLLGTTEALNAPAFAEFNNFAPSILVTANDRVVSAGNRSSRDGDQRR